MPRVRRPRRRTGRALTVMAFLLAAVTLVGMFVFVRNASAEGGLIGAFAPIAVVFVVAFFVLTMMVGPVTGEGDSGPERAPNPRALLRDLALQLPLGRCLLELESGRRIWVFQNCLLVCADIDEGFDVTVTVFDLSRAPVRRSTFPALQLPDRSEAAKLAAEAQHAGDSEAVEPAELQELYEQLEAAVVDTDQRRLH